MRGHVERPVAADAASGGEPSAGAALDSLVLAERVRMLYARAAIAQATVVANACLVAWVFRDIVRPALSISWAAALCALAAARLALVREYRRRHRGTVDAVAWARRFTVAAALTGIGWGAAALIFYAPQSPLHNVFLAFVLGGMAAGAASSNASHTPAFVAFTAPALLPMVVRLGAEREPVHAAMAFMLTLFGVAVGGISRNGGRTMEEAIRLRFRNEELTEAREVLQDSDRRKSEFIAVLSHELRNPLAPIRNSLYLLDHAAPGSDKATLARAIIHRQTDHLARLVDDLLDVTRISTGKVELRRTRFDVREVARRACDDHQALLHGHGLELRLETSEALWIDADEARITQVIGNLLQNAAKFGRSGGTVIVSARPADGQAEIRVRDDGVGIPPDLLPRLFEPFVQAEGGLARSRGGLGLGLAVAKGLVELHGGLVRARSDGPGRGSEFVVSLPLAAGGEQTATGRTQEGGARALDVLVIEDNVDSAQSIAVVLELEGHRVHIASDGLSGIARAHELKPEVILCDIGLPDVDGYQVARTLRFEKHSSARLIAVSGYAQPEDCRRAEEAGFDAHIAKPPSLERLLELVRKGPRPDPESAAKVAQSQAATRNP